MKIIEQPAQSAKGQLFLTRPVFRLHHWLLVGLFFSLTQSTLWLFVLMPACMHSDFMWWTPQLPAITILVSLLGSICGVTSLYLHRFLLRNKKKGWWTLLPLLVIWSGLIIVSEMLTLPFDRYSTVTISGLAVGLISCLYWFSLAIIWWSKKNTREQLVFLQRFFYICLVLSTFVIIASISSPPLKSFNWLYLASFPIFLLCNCGIVLLLRRRLLNAVPTIQLVRTSIQKSSRPDQHQKAALVIALFFLIICLLLLFLSQFSHIIAFKHEKESSLKRGEDCRTAIVIAHQNHQALDSKTADVCKDVKYRRGDSTPPVSDPSPYLPDIDSSRSLLQQLSSIGLYIAVPTVVLLLLSVGIQYVGHWQRLAFDEPILQTRRKKRWPGLFPFAQNQQHSLPEDTSLRHLYRLLLRKAENYNRTWAHLKSETPLEYAQRLSTLLAQSTEADPDQLQEMQHLLKTFTNAYMQERYSQQPVSEKEQQTLKQRVPRLFTTLFKPANSFMRKKG